MNKANLIIAGYVVFYPVVGLLGGAVIGDNLDVLAPDSWERKMAVNLGEKEAGSVNETGNYTVDGIKFEVKQNIPGEAIGTGEIGGDHAKIETNQSVAGFYSTCTHEVVGHLSSGYQHPPGGDSENKDEWIDNLQDQVVVDTCLKLLYRMNGGGKVAG